MIGERFTRLSVVALSGFDRHGFKKWVCQCDCGQTKIVLQGSLKQGLTQSCGCLNAERSAKRLSSLRLKHGHALKPELRSREYRSWEAAKRRCFNPLDKKFPRYGGRGITMCKEWADNFSAFYAYMGPAPAGRTIDRIDNDGNYEPGNCRWATPKEQANNQMRRRKA